MDTPSLEVTLFPVASRDYRGTASGPLGAAQPKLKAFEGLSATYYLRKDHFQAGAFGRAYASLDSDGRAWAIKEVRLEPPKNPAKGAHDTDAELKTRNITALHDFGHELGMMGLCNQLHEPVEFFQNQKGTKAYVVMRLMTGSGVDLMGDGRRVGTLPRSFAAARAGRADIRESAIYRDMLRRLAENTSELHAANVLLSDIKPANILFRRGHVELCDFGMAVRGPEAEPLGGTLAYLPPELFEEKAKIKASCDVYALGVCLAEWMLGRHPLVVASGRKYVKPKEYGCYLAGQPCPHAILLDGRFRQLEQLDADLGRLVRRMMGLEQGRPSAAEVLASPALTLTAAERQVMSASWARIPKWTPAIREKLWELEVEVRALELPYRRDVTTWRP